MQTVKILKPAAGGEPVAVGEGELALINALSRKKLTAEEVYTFAVRLCDNEVDRDGERFPPETLKTLAELFVGKTGIFDHEWSARGQTGRIYRTQLVWEDGKTTRAGDRYCYLKGFAYMLRTEGNRELIAAIEGGILKEVSVGCSVKRTVCSVCGADWKGGQGCPHVKGQAYGGKLCFAELREAEDAYEWSFVAVPAQTAAGVIKQKKQEGEKSMDLKKALEQEPECLKQLEQLEREAEMGRAYLKTLRREVDRLGGLSEPGMSAAVRRDILEKLDAGELQELKKLLEDRARERYPMEAQLTYRKETELPVRTDSAFLI